MVVLVCLVVLLSALGAEGLGKPRKSNTTTFDKLYVSAVKAYNMRNWNRCVDHMEAAIKDHAEFIRILVDCRLGCRNASGPPETQEWMGPEVVLLLRTVNTADCIRRCRRRWLSGRPQTEYHQVLEDAFRKRNPYEYLQFCYFKIGKVQLAASAAYTMFLRNPDNEDMKQNIEYYRTREDVADSEFVDLESKPYKDHYARAMTAYDNEQWERVAEEIEASLAAFYQEEERCRAECEGPLEVDETVDFFGTLADRYITLVKCQASCEMELSTLHVEPIIDFVAEYYHYLQYAYYKIDQPVKAAKAVATHLLLKPDDSVMLSNKNYFLKTGYSEDWFTPRKEAVEFLARKTWMRDFLKKTRWNESFRHLEANQQQVEVDVGRKWMAKFDQIGLKIIHSPQDLGHPYRFVSDGFLRDEQCEALRSFTDSLAYNEQGAAIMTLKDARTHFKKGEELDEVTLRLMLRAAEVSRHYTQRFYNTSAPGLFFLQISIVGWQATADGELPCYPQEDGTCLKELPSQVTEGDFVTVTYLSDIKEDAEFYFINTDDNNTVQMELRPKCGRMVAFQLGEAHSLTVPLRGRRYAFVVQMTSDPANADPEYHRTTQLLQKLDEENKKNLVEENPRVLKELLSSGIHIIRNSSDLQGGERFAADGLADEEQCELLMNLVSALGEKGSGYYGRLSPHTSFELFAGVTLENMTKSGALLGDGYEHLQTKPSLVSPHTKHELFQGLTVFRSAQLALNHLVNPAAVRTFLNLADKVRLLVEKYFNLSQPLHFDFTHLVCRSAVEEFSEDSRDDLSHPVHADNCNLQPDGTCRREFPAFTQRDYSAILYLNEEFAGGNFFFAHRNKSEQVAVRPKCGRMVGFNATELHGVKPVLRGRRCALAMWFTFNPNFKELAHLQARMALDRLAIETSGEEGADVPDVAAPPESSLKLSHEDL